MDFTAHPYGCYVLLNGHCQGVQTGDGDESAFMNIITAFLKLIISHVGAMVSDRFTKDYKYDTTHVCIARTFVARAIANVFCHWPNPRG